MHILELKKHNTHTYKCQFSSVSSVYISNNVNLQLETCVAAKDNNNVLLCYQQQHPTAAAAAAVLLYIQVNPIGKIE